MTFLPPWTRSVVHSTRRNTSVRRVRLRAPERLSLNVPQKQVPSNPWYGAIDELLVFDKALTGTEITSPSNRTGGASNTTYFEYGDHGLVKKITPPTGSPTQFYYDARIKLKRLYPQVQMS